MLFGLSGFELTVYALPCVLLALGAIAGSALGTRLLDRIPEAQFKRGIKLLLSLLALGQIWDGLRGATQT